MDSPRAVSSLLLRLLPLLVAVCAPLVAASADPGVELELDRARFEIVARDLADGVDGPRLRVVLGSPAHPTPSGVFALHEVIRRPGWTPGPVAAAGGAKALAPSPEGPLGVAKIPFASDGAIALHGGAHRLLLGKPVSLGCVRALDEDLLELVEWFQQREALEAATGPGDRRLTFVRPVRLIVR